MTSTTNWALEAQQAHNQSKSEQLLARRALLFDRITDIPEKYHVFRNALLSLWYPCFDNEAIDLALRQLTSVSMSEEPQE